MLQHRPQAQGNSPDRWTAPQEARNVDDGVASFGSGGHAYTRGGKRIRFPWRTITAAVVMLVVGIGLLIAGFVQLALRDPEQARTLGFLVMGALLFIPGSYSSVLLFGAFRRWPGYDWDAVPSYEDDDDY
jgi:hypothetical protein